MFSHAHLRVWHNAALVEDAVRVHVNSGRVRQVSAEGLFVTYEFDGKVKVRFFLKEAAFGFDVNVELVDGLDLSGLFDPSSLPADFFRVLSRTVAGEFQQYVYRLRSGPTPRFATIHQNTMRRWLVSFTVKTRIELERFEEQLEIILDTTGRLAA